MQINDAGSVELLIIKLKRIYKSINDSLMRDREREANYSTVNYAL